MSKTACHSALLVVTLFLLLPATVASAETKKSSSAPSPVAESAKTTKAPSSLPIQSLTLVNADQMAREVAKEASTKAEAAKGAATKSGKGQTKQEASDGVMEFHSINSAPLSDSSAGTFHLKQRKNSMLKNFHGSVYGTAASGIGEANTVGGAAGAESKSGKFNIYVEGAHSHASTGTAH